MYSFQNLDIHFGKLHLFDDISFVVSPGDKLALIGKNGAGKTTLFKIIAKEITPDNGQVVIPKQTKVSYLTQHFEFDESKSIREICLESFQDYFDVIEKIDFNNQLLETEVSESRINDILEKLGELQIAFEAQEVNNPDAEIAKVLKGFGFTEDQFDSPISDFSGGWIMRVQMAKLLLARPDLLLLDEPDNHLDIEALIWFENYLIEYKGAVLFISHDLQFLSNIATRILELANRRIFDFKGSYQQYIAGKDIRREKDSQAFKNQQKVIKEKERTITRFMAKATKTKMAQSMQKQLDKIERVELETDDFNKMNIRFPVTSQPGVLVCKMQNVSKAFDDNLVFENVDLIIERGQKIAFVGQNGQGKSTLIRIMADRLEKSSGECELGHNVVLSYFAQNQSEELDNSLTVLETMESESDPEFFTKARSTLGSFAFSGEDVDKKVSVLSGGEKSRLAMACLVSQKSNFLLLDEPTNHLDVHSKAILKQAIIDYPGTLVIVSHDRDILSGTVDITYEFRNKKIIQHLGDLEYVLSKRKADNIREFERKEKPVDIPKKEIRQKEDKFSYEERKKINRNISRLEKKIGEIESKVSEIHNKLMDPDFYNSPDSAEALKSLKDYESSLESNTEEWESWVSKLD